METNDHPNRKQLRVQRLTDWTVQVTDGTSEPTHLEVAPAPVLAVTDEVCGELPVFNPAVSGWRRGYRLAGVVTQETSAIGMLCADTPCLRTKGDQARELVRGRDYEIDPDWGTVGRLEGGSHGASEQVFASYQHRQARIDSIVMQPDGRFHLKQGQPHIAQPLPPQIQPDEIHLANVFVSGKETALTDANLFPVLETHPPESPQRPRPPAETLVPKAYAKLTQGHRLRLLAWGDSVTQGGYLPHPQNERWQEQFVARLYENFPAANIELHTEAWPGRNTSSYLAEPSGSEHNYREKVLAWQPDLIVSEFVNDAGYQPQQVQDIYGRLAADFKTMGTEWILLTPHYVLPEWMGINRQEHIDDDPRAYVTALRQFAESHALALADASRRWGRLWRQGIPYMTLMMNGINHPDPRGMRIFADSLMELF